MLVDRETLQKNFASMSDTELLERHARGELTDLAFDVIEGELRSRGAQFTARPNPEPDSLRADDQSETNAPLLKSGNGRNLNVLLDADEPDDIDSHGGPTVSEDEDPSDASSEGVSERAPRISLVRVISVLMGALLVIFGVLVVSLLLFIPAGPGALLVGSFALFSGLLLVRGGKHKSEKERRSRNRAVGYVFSVALLFVVFFWLSVQSMFAGIGDVVGNILGEAPCALRAATGYLHCD